MKRLIFLPFGIKKAKRHAIPNGRGDSKICSVPFLTGLEDKLKFSQVHVTDSYMSINTPIYWSDYHQKTHIIRTLTWYWVTVTD